MRLPRTLAACATALLASLAALPAAHAERLASGPHILATPDYQARSGRVPPAEGTAAATMLYYGGTVFTHVKVVSVMWGSTVNPTTVAGVPGFSAALVNSTYLDQTAEYDTLHKGVNGRKPTKQHIHRGSYLGQVQITPHNTSKSLQDVDVQNELKYQISQGVLPPQDLNTLYMVYFPVDVSIELDGILSCRDFGAYHFAVSDLKPTRTNLFYAVEPDCHSSWSSITFAASHEFIEATTDNIPTPGTQPAFPQTWNTSDGYEVADLCGGSGTLTGGGKSYTVSQYFLNSTNRCSTTATYTSP